MATNGAAFFGVRLCLGCTLFYFTQKEEIPLDKKCCKDCKHFSQHYALDSRQIFRIHCGHCKIYPPKSKKPNAAACESFVPGTPPEEAFVSREYLSKQLLQYMLQLDLLPEITPADESAL